MLTAILLQQFQPIPRKGKGNYCHGKTEKKILGDNYKQTS